MSMVAGLWHANRWAAGVEVRQRARHAFPMEMQNNAFVSAAVISECGAAVVSAPLRYLLFTFDFRKAFPHAKLFSKCSGRFT
jgi:hypothetical protein